MFCGKCGAKVDDRGRFCPSCGAPLPPMGAGPVNQGPAGYAGSQPNYEAAPDAAQNADANQAGPMSQGPAGYAGTQPNYGAAPDAAQNTAANQAGPMNQGPIGYAGTQPNYGTAPDAAQNAGANQAVPMSQGPASYAGTQPNYGAVPGTMQNTGAGQVIPMGQGPIGYAGTQTAYAAAPVTARKKNIVPIVAIIAVVAVVAIAVFVLINKDSNSLIGTWQCTEDEDWILTFNKDGTFYDSDSYFLYYAKTGSWNIPTDGQLYFENYMDYEMVKYELNGKTLKIYVNGSVVSYYTFKKIK